MTIVCAWCRSVLGTKPGPEDAVTHGMCLGCLERELASAGGPGDARGGRDEGGVGAVRMDVMLGEGTRPLVAAKFDGEGRVRARVVPEGQP